MKVLQRLNPVSNHFLKEDVVFWSAETYGSNNEDLKTELNQVKRLLEKTRVKEMEKKIIELLVYLNPFKGGVV